MNFEFSNKVTELQNKFSRNLTVEPYSVNYSVIYFTDLQNTLECQIPELQNYRINFQEALR